MRNALLVVLVTVDFIKNNTAPRNCIVVFGNSFVPRSSYIAIFAAVPAVVAVVAAAARPLMLLLAC